MLSVLIFAAMRAKPSHKPSQLRLYNIHAAGAVFGPQCCRTGLQQSETGCALVSVHQCLWACQHDVYNFFGCCCPDVLSTMWFVLVLQTGSLCYGRFVYLFPSGGCLLFLQAGLQPPLWF